MTALLCTITAPLFGASLLWAVPRRLKGYASVIFCAATLAAALRTAFNCLRGGTFLVSLPLTEWFSLSLQADGLAAVMAVVSVFVALAILIYALEYMQHNERQGEFYFWMVLFIGSMMGLVFSANLFLLFCFWELTSVCSWRLIAFYRAEKDIKAADQAFLVTFVGASLMLVGIGMIYFQTGTADIKLLQGAALPSLAGVLLLAGIVSKSAQLPFQTWLPDAGVAPTPVTALLHAAVLVKIGVYVFARLFIATLEPSAAFLNGVLVLASVTIVVSAGSALIEQNIKRILAYSTISQLGYILLAFSLQLKLAYVVGLVYIAAHSLAKAGLFLCAGMVEHATGTKKLSELGGLARTMPLTATAFLLSAFSIMGIPPLFGFWPKFMTILLTVKSGRIMAGVCVTAAAVMTMLYLMRFFRIVFLGPVRFEKAVETRSFMVWVVMGLGVLSLAAGLCGRIPFEFIMRIVR